MEQKWDHERPEASVRIMTVQTKLDTMHFDERNELLCCVIMHQHILLPRRTLYNNGFTGQLPGEFFMISVRCSLNCQFSTMYLGLDA